MCVCVWIQDWYWYTLISYCISNGAYTGCDPPDVGLPLLQQSVSEDNEPVADDSMESGDSGSSQVCHNDEAKQSCAVTSLWENGFVGNVSDLTADEESVLQVDEPGENYSYQQQSGTAPSIDRSTIAVNGSSLTDGITDVVACCGAETVRSDVESQSLNCECLVPIVDIENSAFYSVSPPVIALPASSPPSADVDPLAVGCVQEYQPDNSADKQLETDTDVYEGAVVRAQDELTFAASSPQCLDVPYTPRDDSGAEAAATKQSDVLHCDIDAEAGIRTFETSNGDNLSQINSSRDPPTFNVMNSVEKSLEECRASDSADDTADNFVSDLVLRSSSDQLSTQSVLNVGQPAEFCDTANGTCTNDTNADNSLSDLVFSSNKNQSFSSDHQPSTPSVLNNGRPAECCDIPDSAHANDTSADNSLSDLLSSSNTKQSSFSDQFSTPSILTSRTRVSPSVSRPAEYCDIANNTYTNRSNSVVDYAAQNVVSIAAENKVHISQSVSTAADFKAQSSVVSAKPAAVMTTNCSNRDMIAAPVDVELQQKVIRQMEVSFWTVCSFVDTILKML